MKALTVQQPWATAIIRWGKDVENRSRNIAGAYRGPLAIHAGKTEDECGYGDEMIRQATAEYDDGWLLEDHLEPRGAIIGVVNLSSVHPARPGCCPNRGGKPFGSWWAQSDSWHLCVTDPRPLAVPVPCRGALGLWTPPAEVLAELEAALRGQVVLPSVPAAADEPDHQADDPEQHGQLEHHQEQFRESDASDQQDHARDGTR